MSKDLSEFSMLELFRQEVQQQTAILNDGLLSLENKGAADLEAMMRAAHSLKGAARIVEVDPVVRVAHSMEDGLVAAQRGQVALGDRDIDTLLHGVDMLQRIAGLDDQEMPAWCNARADEIDRLIAALGEIIRPKSAAVSAIAEHEKSPRAASGGSPHDGQAADGGRDIGTAGQAGSATHTDNGASGDNPGRAVRVAAETLDRLMGLAGECLVEVGWLRAFAASLGRLKNNEHKLVGLLEKLSQSSRPTGDGGRGPAHLADARRRAVDGRAMASENMHDFEMFTRRLENLAERLCAEVVATRMRPFGDGVTAFPRRVRDLARKLGKHVRLEIRGKATEVDRDIQEKLETPLYHILQNAVDHGIETPEERQAAGKPPEATICLEARHLAGMLSITVSDDGRGVDLEGLRRTIVAKGLAGAEMAAGLTESELLDFLFLPGFSTARQVTDVSGRGVGLDVVHGMVQSVGGSVRATTRPGKGTSFHLQLPITLSVLRSLLVEIGGQAYAFPLARVDRLLSLPRAEVESLQGHPYCMIDEAAVGLVSAAEIFGGNRGIDADETLSVVVLSDRFHRYGLVVERLLGEHDLVVRPLDARLGKVKDIAAASVTEDGRIVLIADVDDMIGSIDNLLAGDKLRKLDSGAAPGERRPPRVLVVDDSLTVREVQRKLLENNGYEVATAVDGVDGWSALLAGQFDLMISDVDMPRMGGIELAARVRQEPRFQQLPIVMVSYKERAEDRQRGLEAGVNIYLTKSGFHDETLLEAVADLVGRAQA